MWRLQGSGAIFVCWVSVKLRLLFTAGPYWQVVSARCAVWIFIDLWNLRPQNACSLSFLRPALEICVKNADFCVNANPGYVAWWVLCCDCHMPLTHWGLMMNFQCVCSLCHPSLVQVMACCLFSAKSLPKPVLNLWKKMSKNQNAKIFLNTLRLRRNDGHFPDIFKCIFLNENIWISIKISLKFVPKGPINIGSYNDLVLDRQ